MIGFNADIYCGGYTEIQKFLAKAFCGWAFGQVSLASEACICTFKGFDLQGFTCAFIILVYSLCIHFSS